MRDRATDIVARFCADRPNALAAVDALDEAGLLTARANSDSPWLTVEAAAQRTHRHPVTIREALRTGKLNGYQNDRKSPWLIDRADLDRWVRGEKPSTKRRGR